MTTEDTVITDEMRAAIGVESAPAPLEIERGSIRTFTRATGETNPIYYDVEAARAAGHPDLPAPLGFMGRFPFVPGQADATFSGPLDERPFPLGDFKNELHGSMGIRMHRRVHAGERLTMSGRVTGVSERDGRMGRMLIVQSATTYRDEAGDVVAERNDTEIHYR